MSETDKHQTPYEAARAAGQAAIKRELLRVASDLLRSEGPEAITMRKVSKAAGCSTMVLYSTFGSKEGLIEALYLEGVDVLKEAVEGVEEQPNPLEKVVELCRTYRKVALKYDTHYAILFSQAIPAFEPSEESRRLARSTMGPLVQALTRAIEQGLLKPQDPAELGLSIWSAAHGVVTLEIAGYFPVEAEAEPMYDRVIRSMIDGNRLHP